MTRLRWLAGHMSFIGAEMQTVGGFGPLAVHGGQLLGAAEIAASWAARLEQEAAQ